MMLTEYGPLFAASAAVVASGLAYLSSRKPKIDEATADKIKTEIEKDQEANRQEKAKADVKRDRHIVRLEEWAFNKVRPTWRQAATLYDEQNTLLTELATRAKIEYSPRPFPVLPDMPEIDDE